MKQSELLRAKEMFPGNMEYAFKTINARDNSALLARANHQLSQSFAEAGDRSALLAVVCPVQTAIAGLTRGYSAHFRDCFECLSPHNTAA